MMQPIRSLFCRFDRSTIPEVGLLACWFAGSSLGLLAARSHGDAYASFLGSLPECMPGFGGILASAVFPLLLSACAVFILRSVGCFCACLIRGLGQGLLLGVIGQVYGSAAPLMAFLLMFSGLWVNAVLLFFWLRRLTLGPEELWPDVLVCFGLCLVIGMADIHVIAPFLADVINF